MPPACVPIIMPAACYAEQEAADYPLRIFGTVVVLRQSNCVRSRQPPLRSQHIELPWIGRGVGTFLQPISHLTSRSTSAVGQNENNLACMPGPQAADISRLAMLRPAWAA
jgi:hypothetical protein